MKIDTGLYESHIAMITRVGEISPIQMARNARMKARRESKRRTRHMYQYYECLVYRRTMFSN